MHINYLFSYPRGINSNIPSRVGVSYHQDIFVFKGLHATVFEAMKKGALKLLKSWDIRHDWGVVKP